MVNLLKLLLFLLCTTAFGDGVTPLDDTCELWLAAKGKKTKGVMVVTHGLNLRPARLNEFAEFYAANGYEVLRPSFAGHCKGAGDLLKIQPEFWENDAQRFHALAKAKADELKVPLYLTAYSFSALIYQSMSNELPFAKRIYLAPALETHFWYPIVIFLINLWPIEFFRTLIPDGYFAQEYGGSRSVLAMNHFFAMWNQKRNALEKVPTLVWASLSDELVRGPKLKILAESRAGWQFRELGVAGSTLPKSYHHLIVDSAALGPTEWKRVTEESLAFLEKP